MVGSGTKVYLDQGVMLREQGKVYVDVNDRFVSLFKKVALPNLILKGVPTSCHNAGSSLTCNVGDNGTSGTSEFCSPDSVSVAVLAKKILVHMTKNKISLFDSLAGLRNSAGRVDINRKKRGILSVLGLGTGILSMIFSGVTVHKLSAHVNKLEGDWDNFKRLELKRWKRTSAVVNNNFQVLDYRYNSLVSQLNSAKCETILAIGMAISSDVIAIWHRELDHYFSHVDEGNLGGRLSSKILPEEDLLQLLRDHQELNGTAYVDNIMNFYLTSNVVLISAELDKDNFLILHYVVVVPMIYPSRAFDLYQVNVVPIHHDSVCLETSLPGFVYNRSGLLVGTGNSCKMGELVSLCYERVPDTPLVADSCLGRAINCTFALASCSVTRYVYDFSGILIGGKPGDKLYVLNRIVGPGEDKIADGKFSEFGVAFVPWSKAKYVQYRDIRIESPESIISVVSTHTPNYTVDWGETVRKGKVDTLSKGTLEALNVLGLDSDSLAKAQNLWTGPVVLATALGFLGCLLGLANCRWDSILERCGSWLVGWRARLGAEALELEHLDAESEGADPI